MHAHVWNQPQRRARVGCWVGLVVLITLLTSGTGQPHMALAQVPTRISPFGADIRYDPFFQMDEQLFTRETDKAAAASASWARYNIAWDRIQPEDGSMWDGNRVALHQARLRQLLDKGFRPIVTLHAWPKWAVGQPNVAQFYCQAVANRATLQTFTQQLVSAFQQGANAIDPNQVVWQIQNEPDMPGCYSSGGAAAYVEDFNAATDGIRAAGAKDARFALAGMAFDPLKGVLPGTTEFLRQVLANTALKPFAIVDIHAYGSYSAAGNYEPGLATSVQGGWAIEGGQGVTNNKIRAARRLLAVTGRNADILVGEAGLMCGTTAAAVCPDAVYASGGEQATYVLRTSVRALAEGAIGVNWYAMAFGEFAGTDLLGPAPTFAERGGYEALRFLASRLDQSAVYAGDLSSSLYEGYRFCKGQTEYRFYWTNGATARNIVIPQGAVQFYTASGTTIPATTTISYQPIVIETNLGTACLPQVSASWTTLNTSTSFGAPTLFSTIAPYNHVLLNAAYPLGPCTGQRSDTCHFDTRVVYTRENRLYESITAAGRYWTYDVTNGRTVVLGANGLPSSNGNDLTMVARYASGPCAGRQAGTCRFDTRTVIATANGLKEYVTAYGTLWVMNMETGAIESKNSLKSIGRYNGICADAGAGECVFDTLVMLWEANGLVEYITAYGKLTRIQQNTGAVLYPPTNLGSLPRFTAGQGPCAGWPGNACRFRTRTYRTQSDGSVIETITN